MEATVKLTAPEPLGPHHGVDSFSCGDASLDEWLRKRAKPNQVSGASRTFVVCESSDVVAYYTLASSAVTVRVAPGRFRRNMPDPIPVVVLGRLAVATRLHGHGIGRALFRDAALRVTHAADVIGVRGLVVHAISEDAARLYEKLGLERSPLEPLTLMATLADLRAAIG